MVQNTGRKIGPKLRCRKPLEVEDLVRGMVSQTAERVDTKYDEDLTENFVYGANFPNGNLLLVDLQRQDEASF